MSLNDQLHRDSARAAIRPVTAASLALLLLAAAACGRDEGVAPLEPVEGTIAVDASTGWAYLSLADEALVNPANPANSRQWDIAFNGTNVMLNGGQAGTGGVTGYCLCQNSATNPDKATILAYTAASELADFSAVTASTVPPSSAFRADVLRPSVTEWHTGSGATATAASDNTWLVRLRDGKGYAKLRVASLQGPSVARPGTITLQYAVQPTAAAPLGAVGTLAVAVPPEGDVRVDLLGGGNTTSSNADWDIRFEGWTLRLNGGASGPGKVAAYLTDESFDQITTAVTQAQAYSSDAYSGVFAIHPWYRYNLTGSHDITPIFDVYLVRSGDQVYKLQLTDYYGPAGEDRQITVRYARLVD